MFESKHFVPILRSKMAERLALRNLLPADRKRITPLIELTPASFKGRKRGEIRETPDPVRVLNEEGVRMRDLPVLSGVSKESIAMAMGILRKKNLVEVEKVVRLNAQGIEAQKEYLRRLALLEARWKDTDALQAFTTELLLRGIEPYPDN